MRLKTDVVLAAGIACLLAFSLPAFGTPLPRDPVQAHRAQRAVRHGVRVAQLAPRRAASRQAARQPSYLQRIVTASSAMFNGKALVAEARKYIGTNPTDRKRLWCATFMNFILGKLGYAGTHSDAAKSFAYYGRRIHKPEVGAIAVLTRGKRGGHVGVVSGIDAHGNPIIISGNHNRRVGVGIYPRSRVIAYVLPTKRHAPVQRQAARGPAAPRQGIDSPITELLAVINAEAARAEARASTREAARAPVRRAPVRRVAPPAPHRVVQQTPDQADHRDLPLDPNLAEFLGIRRGAPQPHAQTEARR